MILMIQGDIMEHFASAKTLFVLKRYDIANACIMPTLFCMTFTFGKHRIFFLLCPLIVFHTLSNYMQNYNND